MANRTDLRNLTLCVKISRYLIIATIIFWVAVQIPAYIKFEVITYSGWYYLPIPLIVY